MHSFFVYLAQEAAPAAANVAPVFEYSPWEWWGFLGLVAFLLFLDLGVLHRKAHVVSVKEAVAWSVFWVCLAMGFNVWLYWRTGSSDVALQFLAGYLTEESLSVDNLFVILLIFSYFRVPAAYQHRVLFWGIVGAVAMRFVFIWLGAELVERFHKVLLLFAAFLVFSGIRLLMQGDESPDLSKNRVLRLFKRLVPTTAEFHGSKFWVIVNGRRMATPLFAVLAVIEASDLVFAVDSIPAIFGLTQDRYVIFTSNVFAILGLRSLFFLMAHVMDRFHYLKIGLGLVLVFIGVKMGLDFTPWSMSIQHSLGIIATILAVSIATSIIRPKPRPAIPPLDDGPSPPPAPVPAAQSGEENID